MSEVEISEFHTFIYLPPCIGYPVCPGSPRCLFTGSRVYPVNFHVNRSTWTPFSFLQCRSET